VSERGRPAAPRPEVPGPSARDPKAPERTIRGPEQPPGEVGGPAGPEPTRYGDWEKGGRVSDF
jgi:hypothetical protein